MFFGSSERQIFGVFWVIRAPKSGAKRQIFGVFLGHLIAKIGRDAPDFGCFRAADAAADEAAADAHAADAEPCLRHETLPCSAMALYAKLFLND